MAKNAQRNLALLQANFAEIHPALAADDAIDAAARCLYCYDAPCTRACPTHIDIPRFIRQILHRDPLGAARTILDANIFGGSCARVCPVEVLCEGACVDNTLLNVPVEIGRLQRYACDAAHAASFDFYRPGPPTGRRVAIVGAGPAGLTCAHELRKRGHEVVLLEARDVPGGLNTLGIAAYKISTEFALSEVDRILQLGIDLRLKSPVNGQKLRKLLDEYDAVFLGIGLGHTAPLNIPGEDLKGVWESLAFIFQTHTRPLDKCTVGRHVVVIGGGNTAIDAANAAVRLGAENVTVAYRRDKRSMPAFEHEYELAMRSGVQFQWLARPLRIVGNNGKVAGVRFIRTRTVASARRGGRPRTSGAVAQGEVASYPGSTRPLGRRAALKDIPRSEFTLPCDMVVKALGQEAIRELLRALPDLRLTPDGRVEVDPATMATSVPKLFAGGDCQAGAGEEVVNAAQDGKLAAAGIHALLGRASPRF